MLVLGISSISNSSQTQNTTTVLRSPGRYRHPTSLTSTPRVHHFGCSPSSMQKRAALRTNALTIDVTRPLLHSRPSFPSSCPFPSDLALRHPSLASLLVCLCLSVWVWVSMTIPAPIYPEPGRSPGHHLRASCYTFLQQTYPVFSDPPYSLLLYSTHLFSPHLTSPHFNPDFELPSNRLTNLPSFLR